MIKSIFIFFSLFILFTFNAFAFENSQKIIYGYPSQSIFIATINGKEQPITPMLNVAEELFKKAEIPWEAEVYPAKRLFRNLKNGKVNFTILVRASSLLKTHIFSKNPIYRTSLNTYYIGNKKPIIKKEDLIGSRVVTIRGYSYGKLRKFLEDPKNNITLEVSNTHRGAFKMLKLNRADYLLDYDSAAKDIIAGNSIDQLKSNKLNNLDIFLVLSKSYPNAQKIMEKLEAIIESMDINGIINKNISKAN